MKTRKKLGELLVESGLLIEERLTEALAEKDKSGLMLGQYLSRSGLVSELSIMDMLCHQLKLEKYTPENYPIDMGLADVVPLEVSLKCGLVPIKKTGRLVTVAMPDPTGIDTLDSIESLTGCEVEPVICSEHTLEQLRSSIYGMHSSLGEVMGSIEEMQVKADAEPSPAINFAEEIQIGSLMDMIQEAPVVSLVNSIIAQAVRDGASDIHISPEKATASVRFRIDGKLHDAPAPPRSMLLPIISRVKILAGMDIAVLRVPQDGRFTVKMETREINIRASTLPTIHGENLVLRLLDMSSGHYTLDRLGMSEADRSKIAGVIQKPYGMLLSTGPTGSGKSTSLYAILREVNQPDTNIITLEDPVEYRVDRIRQVQLNRKAGMTFASGLRSILRQDPDVIMVGEIRDSETATIAVQAALTGHRLLSTIHTNDAAGAITRLMDMGIEPFLVSSVLLVSFAQRLVRTVCPSCKEPYTPPEKALEMFGIQDGKEANFMRGRGCYNCLNTGYRGRMGIFEILVNDEMIHDMILRRVSAQEITRAARESGALKTLKEDAADKVLRGITTLEEAASAVMA